MSASAAAIDAVSGTPAWSGTRSAAATRARNESGWRTDSSERNATGRSGFNRVSASTASRVLPDPPAGHGDEPRVAQQWYEVGQLTVPPDEAGLGER